MGPVADNLALKRAMECLDLSQQELAERVSAAGRDTAGCNRAMVYRWIHGISHPQRRYLRALEKVTGMPASTLGFGEARPSSLIIPNGEVAALDGVAADAAAMQEFRKADLRVGGSHLYATVVRYLTARVAPRLVEIADRSVFTSASAVSDMAGWMAHDAGRDHVARLHFTRALDFVSVSGDRQVTAHILASLGHISHQLNDHHEALRAARLGLDALRLGPRDPDLEARLHAIEARGFAALHEPAEVIRCLSLAEKALQGRREEPRSQWVSQFDEGSLASEAARCMHQLGELSEARRQAEVVLSLRPPDRPRSRAFGMFVTANVLLASGHPDAACAVAADILQATDGLGSYVIVQHFLDLQEQLKPYRSNAAVREFLACLGPALRKRQSLKGIE